MNEVLILFASAREYGNTRKIAEYLKIKANADLLDITKLNISVYDYQHRNRDDDFIRTLEKILAYRTFVFITPVYWYSMAAPMKIFFDRLSDLITIRKDLGRSLAGKYLAAVCCSSDAEEYPGFFLPFEGTAAYLDMIYLGDCHTWIERGEIPASVLHKIDNFALRLLKINTRASSNEHRKP